MKELIDLDTAYLATYYFIQELDAAVASEELSKVWLGEIRSRKSVMKLISYRGVLERSPEKAKRTQHLEPRWSMLPAGNLSALRLLAQGFWRLAAALRAGSRTAVPRSTIKAPGCMSMTTPSASAMPRKVFHHRDR